MENKRKIAFFIQGGMDSFVNDIIKNLSEKYETKKIIVMNQNQITEGMKWADICWFEWCDWIVIHGSNQEIAKDKKIICRIHSYEAFTNSIYRTNWNNIDKIIFISENIRNIVLSKVKINKQKTVIIPNGLDLNKYTYKDRSKGFNIAFVGYMNFKKGPMLLLHTFKELVNKDNRYKLYIAGKFQEERYKLYFNQMKKELGIEDNVIFDGWQNNMNEWLEDKNYILCTSILESQNMSVMEAMSKGIKPIVHNFVGCKNIYDKKYIWNSIDEAVNMISSNEYDSKQYKDFIENKYSLIIQQQKILELLNTLIKQTEIDLEDKPLVTVGIINYNYKNFLDQSVMSVLNQNYKNIEILIIDDCSTDGSIEKIKKYEEKYNNIRGIYHNKNSGSAVLAFREIIENANGEYILNLSADDYLYSKNVVSRYLYEFINNKNLDYVYGDIQLIDISGNQIDVWNSRQYSDEEVVYYTFIRMGSGVVSFSGMIKTDFYRRNKLTFIDDPNNRVAGDTLNILIYLKYGLRTKYINSSLVSYRRHQSNMTYDLKNRIKSIISVMEYIVKNFSEQIYFPQDNWNKYDKNKRSSIKMYKIAKHYYDTAEVYYNKRIRLLYNYISLDKEQIKEYIQPLIILAQEYLNKSVSISKGQTDIKEINDLKIKINAMKIYLPGILKSSIKHEIYIIGNEKRKSLLKEYKNKYLDRNFKILMNAPPTGEYYYQDFMNWKQVFEHMGISVDIIQGIDKDRKYDKFNIFINIADKGYIDRALSNDSIINIPKKVGIVGKERHFTNSMVSNRDLENIDLITNKFKYNLLISSFSNKAINIVFKEWIDKGFKIKSIPFGFNPIIHYPELVPERYDYFYVGTNSYFKRENTNKYLMPILNRNTGILRGLKWGNNIPSLQSKDCRFFYSRSKINLNCHLTLQHQFYNEINQRTFVISACGGFQLIDNPNLLKEYYDEKDMAIAHDPKEYFEKFDYYLNKPKERHQMALNSLIKTYENNWSLFSRLEEILDSIL